MDKRTTKKHEKIIAGSDAATVMAMRQLVMRASNKTYKVIVISQLIAIVGLSFVCWQMFSHQPEQKIIGLTNDMRVITLAPLSDPKLSNAQIVAWATRAVIDTYTFDFVNYRGQLQKAGNEYFTQEGFVAFAKELKSSGVLDRVKEGKYVLSTTVTSTPTIVSQGQINGRHAWKIQAPVVVTLQNSGQRSSEKRLVEIVALRSQELLDKGGVGITRFAVSKLEE